MAGSTSGSGKPCCSKCQKTDIELKKCGKCRLTSYCSRDCQAADWKVHKRACGRSEQNASTSSGNHRGSSAPNQPSPGKGLEAPTDNPYSRLHSRTWLHDRPEKDVYKLLIDTYRLRMEDNYTFDGDADLDSIYGGAAHGLRGFRRLLAKAKSRPNILPPWWNDEKQKECEAVGMGGSDWSDLAAAVEKADVNEEYGDPRFAMQLRLLGEQVYGRGPGGQAGAPMIRQMMALESGALGSNATLITIDHTTGRVG
ncbi:hypothetical protein BJ170DRAFT_620007 [Xylariales sp. AK1849]|nr:hypothetical protein BJ170DRAFT_620007 [Xylariales sp. AK1849]